ncbi:MAG: hypothetical protein IT289_00140 [Oligoflexia bacterium]|nr:hypothetical protein [Oligoflexia bacterium]
MKSQNDSSENLQLSLEIGWTVTAFLKSGNVIKGTVIHKTDQGDYHILQKEPANPQLHIVTLNQVERVEVGW